MLKKGRGTKERRNEEERVYEREFTLEEKRNRQEKRKKIGKKKRKENYHRIPSSKLNFNLLTSLHCFNEFHDRNQNNSLYTMQMAKKDSKKD